MKKYIAPEIEELKYNDEDCLIGSSNIPKESENIGGLIGKKP